MLGASLTLGTLVSFLLTLLAGVTLLYAALLAFSALVFWNPGFLFTWVINDLFQLARYPVGLYSGWLRLVLTWIIPVGLMTTIPAQALVGTLSPWPPGCSAEALSSTPVRQVDQASTWNLS